MTCCPKEWWKISQEKGPKCLRIRPQEMLLGISTVLSWWSSYLTQPIRRRKSVHVLGLLVLGEEIGTSDKNMASYTQSFWWCPLSLQLSMPHIFLRVSFKLFKISNYASLKQISAPELFTSYARLFTWWIPFSATANLTEVISLFIIFPPWHIPNVWTFVQYNYVAVDIYCQNYHIRCLTSRIICMEKDNEITILHFAPKPHEAL